MPLRTKALPKNAGKKMMSDAISKDIETMMSEYHKSGKLGNAHPKDAEHARKMAAAIAYGMTRKRKAGGM